MLCKNDIYETEIISYTAEGSGVCKIDGIAVFVPFAAAGDRLRVRIVKTCKTYAYGKIEEILLPSPERATPPCEVFGKCGGCSVMHLSYAEQLRFKQNHVADCIKRIGGIDCEVLPTLAADRLCGYRNKVQLPVGRGSDGNIIAGFYSQRSHRVVQSENCIIQNKFSNKITDTILTWMREYGISAYDEASGKGFVRHIYIRSSEASGEIMVVLVINKKSPECISLLAEQLKICGVTAFSVNINSDKTNVVLGKKTINIFGSGKITDILCGLKFEISPLSFYQVNHDQAEKLYNAATDFAGITKDDTVLDLYCGTGTITLHAARYAKKAIGIEIVPEAIEDAKRNMRLNNIENAEFYCGDAGKVTKQLLQQGVKPDKIIIDPPRKGCDTETLKLIAELAPENVVYVSCNPATLARDLKIMQEYGYITEKVQPVDMFVHSHHVESVALLCRTP